MKQLFLLLSIFIFSFSFGQKWLHDGAEWHYSSTGEAQNLFHHLTYEKDTVIHGENWQQVHHVSFWYIPTSPDTDTLLANGNEYYYYRMNMDTVFKLIITTDTIFSDVAFIFANQATWLSNEYILDDDCDHDIVYRSKQSTFNGFDEPIDSYLLSFKSAAINDSVIAGSYSPRFGCISGALYPTSSCSAEGFYFGATFGLICYQDNDGFAIKNTSGECDYYMTLNTKNASFEQLSIYPNPARDEVFIQSEAKIDRVECYDLYGKLVPITYDVISKKVILNQLPQGVYLLKMESGGNFKMERLVIE